MYQWVLEGAHHVVDEEDNAIVIPKNRDRILRVQRFTISVKNRDETFTRYFTAESKTHFVNVTWRGIRDHHIHGRYNGFGERNAQFMCALFYDYENITTRCNLYRVSKYYVFKRITASVTCLHKDTTFN